MNSFAFCFSIENGDKRDISTLGKDTFASFGCHKYPPRIVPPYAAFGGFVTVVRDVWAIGPEDRTGRYFASGTPGKLGKISRWLLLFDKPLRR